MATVPIRRVVVTGIGAISPLGNTLVDSWSALLQNEHGMTSLEEAIVQHQQLSEKTLAREMEIAKILPCQVAAPVKGVLHVIVKPLVSPPDIRYRCMANRAVKQGRNGHSLFNFFYGGRKLVLIFIPLSCQR